MTYPYFLCSTRYPMLLSGRKQRALNLGTLLPLQAESRNRATHIYIGLNALFTLDHDLRSSWIQITIMTIKQSWVPATVISQGDRPFLAVCSINCATNAQFKCDKMWLQIALAAITVRANGTTIHDHHMIWIKESHWYKQSVAMNNVHYAFSGGDWDIPTWNHKKNVLINHSSSCL